MFGPHICGEGLDIDEKYDHILTASWRRENPFQVSILIERKLYITAYDQ